VITYFIDEHSNIYLLAIYSKSDQENITDLEIIELLREIK